MHEDSPVLSYEEPGRLGSKAGGLELWSGLQLSNPNPDQSPSQRLIQWNQIK